MRGETVTLQATRWSGEAPLLGDYLSAGKRARYAYRIVDVRVVKAKTAGGSRYALTCVREDKSAIPPFAHVHRWHWADRGPSRSRRAPQLAIT